jgi:molecular chaperone DnaK
MFYTMYDGQEKVEVTAYQGEGHLPEENTLVGKYMIDGLADVPAGNALVLHFELDLNGMLKATTTEKATGLSRSITMDTRASNVIDIEEARRNVASLAGEGILSDSSNEGPEALLASAKNMRQRAEALASAGINEEDAAEIRRLVHESSRAIAERQWEELDGLNDSLSDLLFYLED